MGDRGKGKKVGGRELREASTGKRGVKSGSGGEFDAIRDRGTSQG